MNENWITVGKMAKMNNISAQALRMYCDMNLIKPVHISEETGYRYFDIRQSYIIDTIIFLQQLGFSLKDIYACFSSNSTHLFQEILLDSLTKIQQQKNELEITEKTINKLTNQIDTYSQITSINTIYFEHLPEQFFHFYEIEKVDFHESNGIVFEKLLRQAKDYIREANVSLSYFYNAGSTISKEDTLKGIYQSNKIFILGDSKSILQLDYGVFPAGLYACILFEEFHDEIYYRELLLNTIKERKLEIIGDLICEPVLEVPFFENIDRKSLLRMRIQVKEE